MSCRVNDGGWTQLGQQAFEPVPRFAERWQVTREVSERSMQSPQRTAEFPWLRRRSLRVVWDELPQRHPQPVPLVGTRRQDFAGRNHQVTPLGHKGPDGYLARQPLLDVIVQERRPGHHPRDNRCGLQVNQYVAARGNPHSLVTSHAMLTRDGLCGRKRGGFAGLAGHAAHRVSRWGRGDRLAPWRRASVPPDMSRSTSPARRFRAWSAPIRARGGGQAVGLDDRARWRDDHRSRRLDRQRRSRGVARRHEGRPAAREGHRLGRPRCLASTPARLSSMNSSKFASPIGTR